MAKKAKQVSSSALTIELDYIAQPKQRLFHQNEAKYRLFIGAWRSGKSYAGCMEALKKSLIYAGNCGLIGRRDFTDLRDTTLKTFLDVCPPEVIASYNKTEHHIIFKNGSEIYFRELKDRGDLGSLELGWFYIDEAEQVDEGVFDYLKGRLSKKGVGKTCGWITSNPPNEDHWIYNQFEVNTDPEYFTIHASTYENKEHLPEGYIADLEKLPSSWRKKYLEGQYGFTPDGTPYYQGYLENLHKRPLVYNSDKPLLCGWDSGRRHPAFVVTQFENGVWKILAEIMGSEIRIDQFTDLQVLPLLNTKFPSANCIHYAGPEFLQGNDKSDYTSFQILKSKGIELHIKHSEYALRKELIEKKINNIVNGEPCLMVDPTCKIINDGFLGGYHYPTKKEGQSFGINFELPFKDGFYEHLMNSLEYIAVNVFHAVDRQPRKHYAPKAGNPAEFSFANA